LLLLLFLLLLLLAIYWQCCASLPAGGSVPRSLLEVEYVLRIVVLVLSSTRMSQSNFQKNVQYVCASFTTVVLSLTIHKKRIQLDFGLNYYCVVYSLGSFMNRKCLSGTTLCSTRS